jgi:hypothetical protein
MPAFFLAADVYFSCAPKDRDKIRAVKVGPLQIALPEADYFLNGTKDMN